MKFATKPSTHFTLGTLLHYLGKLKLKFSADIQQIWKKMHTGCIFVASIFVIDPQIFIFSVFKKRVVLYTGWK